MHAACEFAGVWRAPRAGVRLGPHGAAGGHFFCSKALADGRGRAFAFLPPACLTARSMALVAALHPNAAGGRPCTHTLLAHLFPVPLASYRAGAALCASVFMGIGAARRQRLATAMHDDTGAVGCSMSALFGPARPCMAEACSSPWLTERTRPACKSTDEAQSVIYAWRH